jgi:hypothetical protein
VYLESERERREKGKGKKKLNAKKSCTTAKIYRYWILNTSVCGVEQE